MPCDRPCPVIAIRFWVVGSLVALTSCVCVRVRVCAHVRVCLWLCLGTLCGAGYSTEDEGGRSTQAQTRHCVLKARQTFGTVIEPKNSGPTRLRPRVRPCPRDALEGKGPHRRPQKRLGRRLGSAKWSLVGCHHPTTQPHTHTHTDTQGAYRTLCEKLAVLHHREFGKFRRLKGRH